MAGILLRAYRKNDYQGVLEGYIIETGIGFIISVDYNKFRELLLSQKEKEKRRAERKLRQEKNKTLEAAGKTSSND